MTNIYAALEIGTTRTVLAIGEAETGGRLKVACHAQIPSTGVRKSQILDINQATQSVRSVIRETERNQLAAGNSLTIGNAFLVVSGQHIKADPFKGTVQVDGAKVGADDINEVAHAARQMALPRDRELLDIIDQAYGLDNLGGIVQPKGMSGRILTLDTLQIHADANRINDARTAAGGAHLEIREPLFAASCAAEAVLTDNEKRNGALVLDLGGGSTGFSAYSDGYLAHAGVLGVGGDHVTNDIAHAFQTTQTQAEELKLRDACAMIGVTGGEPRVKVPGSSPLMESRTISRRALDTVVNARLKELLGIVRWRSTTSCTGSTTASSSPAARRRCAGSTRSSSASSGCPSASARRSMSTASRPSAIPKASRRSRARSSTPTATMKRSRSSNPSSEGS